MRVILVDDEPLAMERFCILSKEMPIVDVVGKFELAEEAIEFVKSHEVELAVLDIEMCGMNGIELAKELRKFIPNLQIMFITGHEQYALKGFRLHAVAYLVKPYNFEELSYAIKTTELLMQRKPVKVLIKTFGRFEVFVDGKPVFFKSAKAKELLALMVDAKGGPVSSGFAISMLWEERPFDEKTQSLYYKTAKSLEETLEKHDIGHIIIKTRYERCLNRKEVECDYYQYLIGEEEGVKAFHGEYMSQYSWGEETLAALLYPSGIPF